MKQKVSKATLINNKRGISLLELLIYIAILSGLMVVVSDAFIMFSKGRAQAEVRSEVNSAIRFAGSLIKQDIKSTTTATLPVLGVSGDTLSLTVSGSTVVYSVLDGVLLRKVDTNAPEAVTGGYVRVDTPSFTRYENYNSVLGATTTSIQTVITMRYNASGSDWAYADTIRTTTVLR